MNTHVSRQQVSKIWALANALGISREMLYLMVPRGSISALEKAEASELIERLVRLQGGNVSPAPAKPADPNAPTPEQLHFIYFLFGRLGWLENPARARGFLQKFCGATSIEAIPDRKTAVKLTEALKAMSKRKKPADAGRG